MENHLYDLCLCDICLYDINTIKIKDEIWFNGYEFNICNHCMLSQIFKCDLDLKHEMIVELKRYLAARNIQRKMMIWLYSPYTKDGKMGLIPARNIKEINKLYPGFLIN
jgi:hypothetical protein